MQFSDLVEKHKETKISILGSNNVGKTQLIQRLIHHQFKPNILPGKSPAYIKKTLVVDNKSIALGKPFVSLNLFPRNFFLDCQY